MNTIYFVVYEGRREHFWSYPFTWKSLLRHVDLAQDKAVVTSYCSSEELLSQIPPAIEVRRLPGHPALPVWPGILADYVKWETSNEGSPEDCILFVDARDTIFQRDPFEDILGIEIAASCEGVNHDRCSWNMWDHNNVKKYFPREIWPRIEQCPVVNFGTVGGRRSQVRLAMLAVWMMGCRFNGGGSDQGAWNIMWNDYLRQEKNCWLCHPAQHDWCIVGDHSAHLSTPPYLQDGMVFCGATHRPYAIVHQWERGDCLWNREELIRRWT